jgi:carboxypeptidase C (cathepsin A)
VPEQPPDQPKPPPPKPPAERESVTEHTARIDGHDVPYRAVASTTNLTTDDGEVRASAFTVAYTRTDVDDAASRPLTFVFNGGPGSASAWLHMGMVGPRRVELPDAPGPPPAAVPAPYRLVDSEASLLDVSDLVFIDPISTGYSRVAPGQEAKQFHGVREDVESVAELIRRTVTKSARWASPKYLVGESYGTTRAAALADHLQQRHGIYLAGVGLISAILMFQAAQPVPGNDLPYVLLLPTYAATAWFHGLIDRARFPSLRTLVDDAEKFALGDYASLLLLGSRATADARRSVAERLVTYTGLAAQFLESCDLRVRPDRFFKQLLRFQRRTVGRLDTRFTGIDADAAGESASYDPSYSFIQGPFTAAVNHYLNSELDFASDLEYEVLNSDRVQPWSFGHEGENRYLDVASSLRQAMSMNRGLRVLLASGYYDVATPFAAAEWTLDHMALDPTLAGNVRKTRFEAGHMMYIHEPSRSLLAAELRSLVRGWPAAATSDS